MKPFGYYGRHVALLQWARELVEYLHRTTKVAQIAIAQHRLLKVVYLCRMTYNVDPHHLASVLNSDEDLACLIECSLLIQDNCPTDIHSFPFNLHQCLLQDGKLSHAWKARFAISLEEADMD